MAVDLYAPARECGREEIDKRLTLFDMCRCPPTYRQRMGLHGHRRLHPRTGFATIDGLQYTWSCRQGAGLLASTQTDTKGAQVHRKRCVFVASDLSYAPLFRCMR